MNKTAAIKLWVSKVASLWLDKKSYVDPNRPSGSQWDQYDRVIRLAILEGAAHVPLSSWTRFGKGPGIQTVAERILSTHPNVQPAWFDYKGVGIALDLYEAVKREFIKFKKLDVSPMEIIHANLMGLSAQSFDPDEIHRVASAFYRTGDKNKTKILDGTYGPTDVTNVVIGLLAKAVTSPTRAYLTQEVLRHPTQDRSVKAQITRLINASDEQKKTVLRAWQQAGIHPAFASIMAGLYMFWSRNVGQDDSNALKALAEKYQFSKPSDFMLLVKKGLGISDRIIGVKSGQMVSLDKEHKEDAPGHALHETIKDTGGTEFDDIRSIVADLLSTPNHPVSRRLFRVLEDDWQQMGGNYERDGQTYDDGVYRVMAELMKVWQAGGGFSQEADIKKRLAEGMGVSMQTIGNWKEKGTKGINFVIHEPDIERLLERYIRERTEGRRMASKKSAEELNWTKYDQLVRIGILEGVAKVPQGTWLQKHIDLVQLNEKFSSFSINPQWLTKQDTGLAHSFFKRLERYIDKTWNAQQLQSGFGAIPKTSALEMMHTLLIGVSSLSVHNQRTVRTKSPFHTFGHTYATDILVGKVTPNAAFNDLVALGIKNVTSQTRETLRKEIYKPEDRTTTSTYGRSRELLEVAPEPGAPYHEKYLSDLPSPVQETAPIEPQTLLLDLLSNPNHPTSRRLFSLFATEWVQFDAKKQTSISLVMSTIMKAVHNTSPEQLASVIAQVRAKLAQHLGVSTMTISNWTKLGFRLMSWVLEKPQTAKLLEHFYIQRGLQASKQS